MNDRSWVNLSCSPENQMPFLPEIADRAASSMAPLSLKITFFTPYSFGKEDGIAPFVLPASSFPLAEWPAARPLISYVFFTRWISNNECKARHQIQAASALFPRRPSACHAGRRLGGLHGRTRILRRIWIALLLSERLLLQRWRFGRQLVGWLLLGTRLVEPRIGPSWMGRSRPGRSWMG